MPTSSAVDVTMNMLGRPDTPYDAQAIRGRASGHDKIRVDSPGVRGVPISINASHSHGAREGQSGRIAPGSPGVQLGTPAR